jgi:alkylation response protein AidB-like acyl-CoA dehydrogenase
VTTALDSARDLFATIAENADRTSPDPVPAETVAALVEADLHAISSPKEVGGTELALVDQMDVLAEVSRADGSAGWILLANTATIAFFGAWAGDDFAQDLFADGVPLAAGQFAPNGVAVPTDGGYRATGDYQFGSGINHSTWVGAGTITEEAEGIDPRFLFALMPIEDVELKGNWDVLGLQSTASYDYAVRDVFVPEQATFDFFAPVRRRGGPAFDLGVMCLTAVGHAGFALGVTRRVLDELVAIARGKHRMGAGVPLKDSDRFLHTLGVLESRYRAAEAWVRNTVEAAEASAVAGAPDFSAITACRQATVFLTQEGADIAREAYLLAGTSGLRDGPLQRGFRDLHAGSQHFFASDAATLDLGRELMA